MSPEDDCLPNTPPESRGFLQNLLVLLKIYVFPKLTIFLFLGCLHKDLAVQTTGHIYQCNLQHARSEKQNLLIAQLYYLDQQMYQHPSALKTQYLQSGEDILAFFQSWTGTSKRAA